MSCPGCLYNGNCNNNEIIWTCIECKNIFNYEYDKYLYCNCGRAKLEHCKFRCNHPEHGNSYVCFDNMSLNMIAKKPEPGDEFINVLLLGETGVGKSTFINSLANYLENDSLESAIKNEIIVPIFTKLDVDINGKNINLSIGKKDDNEKGGVNSSTQSCMSYLFPYNDRILRIIDTPGIGDTRGHNQDKKNLSDIMSFIDQFEKLDGICILLKSDQNKLTESFKYCIDELLTHLHTNAKNNIVFVFTHSRGSYYREGKAYKVLKEHIQDSITRKTLLSLNPNTLYCIDNEPFEFLALIKNDQTFNDETKRTISASWNISSQTSIRLINYFMSIKPHKTAESTMLYTVRNIILSANEPMAQITCDLLTDIQTLEEQKEVIKDDDKEISVLTDYHLKIPYTEMETKALDYTRTVCTADKCCTKTSDGKHVHSTVCHDECKAPMSNITTLYWCSCMNILGNCNVCKHFWTWHKHINTEYISTQKFRIDESVRSQINQKQSQREKKDKLIQSKQKRIDYLKEIKDKFTESRIKCAVFLIKNSMIPYNNFATEYINICIKTHIITKVWLIY